jgi:hypothetical protein
VQQDPGRGVKRPRLPLEREPQARSLERLARVRDHLAVDLHRTGLDPPEAELPGAKALAVQDLLECPRRHAWMMRSKPERHRPPAERARILRV